MSIIKLSTTASSLSLVTLSRLGTQGVTVGQLNAFDLKELVKVATTNPGILATDFEPGDTIDGVILAVGDRILIKDQLNGVENGIHVVQGAGAPVRSDDMALGASASGNQMYVDQGTVNGEKIFVCTTNKPNDVVGTDALTFIIAFGLTSTPPIDVDTNPAAVGTAGVAARSDHKHDVATATAVGLDASSTNTEGGGTTLARAAHTHALDVTSGTLSTVNAGDAAVDGTAIGLSRRDHQHAVATGTPGTISPDDAAAEGVSTSLARADHTHTIAAAAAGTIEPDDAAAEGVATSFARSDHRHAIAAAAPSQGIGGGNTEGSATSFSRSDHNHALRTTTGPTDLTIAGIADGEFLKRSGTAIVGAAAPGGEINTASNIGVAGVGVFDQKVGVDLQFRNINVGSARLTVTDDSANNEIDLDVTIASATGLDASSTNTAGTAVSLTNSDHTHAIKSDAAGGGGAVSTINAGDAAVEGTGTAFSRRDHQHAVATAAAGTIAPDDAAAEGVSTSLSRADHTHGIVAAAPGTIEPDDAAAEGAAASFARSDHQHAIAAAAPSQGIGGGNTEGASTGFARADHDHTLRTTTGPTDLTITTIADGEFLQRSGSNIIGAAARTVVEIPLRNESGSTIARGKMLFAAGFASGRVTVGLADKDDPAKRPAIAVTTASVPNLTNFNGMVAGVLDNFDTSAFGLTDQLVLGDDGDFSRPPPDQDPFTGEVQSVGSTLRISATVGSIQVLVSQGLQAMTADEGFGLPAVLGRGRKFGGALSRGAGLNLDVAAGEGFVTDGTEYRRVVWSADTIALTANATNFVFVDSAGTVTRAAFAPDQDTNIGLGSARTDATSIVFLSEHDVALTKRNAGIHQLLQEIVGPVTSSGGLVTINGVDGLKIDVDAAVFYIIENRRSIAAVAPITFTYWFRDGSGGFNFTTGQTQVDVNNFDDGSGTLAAMTAGKFKKDALYVAVFGSTVEYHLVYGQEQFDSQSEAEAGNLPVTSEDLRVFAWRSSGVVILKAAAAITSIVDERPFIGQLSTGTTAASDHGQLAGLGDDDHPQYQLRSEENAANGYAGLDGSTKLNGAQQTYGTAVNTAAEGNDPRLSDDRTANGIRTATTVVAVSAATAPTAGQVLTATSGTAANWQTGNAVAFDDENNILANQVFS